MAQEKEGNLHVNHRARMKERFLQNGIDVFPDHNVMELMLFYAVPRRDVNPLAHTLLRRFGTLAGVFDAGYEELLEVEGVGENIATLIKLVPQVARRYQISRESVEQTLDSTKKLGTVLTPYFFGEQEEVVYLLCMDAKCKVLGVRLLGRGTLGSANVSLRKLVETALRLNTAIAVLAHNHPSGNAVPSVEDREVTRKVFDALDAVNILLADHLVVADGDFVSLNESGMMRFSRR